MAEKRTDERIELTGYIVKIIDNSLCNSVAIRDVSMGGLRLIRVPSKLAYKESPTKITLSGNRLSECYKLTIMPCWRKKNEFYWDVGFYIHRVPVSWKRFVRIKKMQTEKNRGTFWCL
ncbi:MAG: hypothetical protein D3922_16990 [Candidatus Electrothrix sp. AR1]|nr:hypothetical protein [Candidatus Electrothrix sp. AR1]